MHKVTKIRVYTGINPNLVAVDPQIPEKFIQFQLRRNFRPNFRQNFLGLAKKLNLKTQQMVKNP